MSPISEIKDWLAGFSEHESVGIGEDGLSLKVVDDGQVVGYCEIGGIPEEIERNEALEDE